jgi:hypothetical protein
MYPVLQRLAPRAFSTLRELGLAMIEASVFGTDSVHVEVLDIRALAKQMNLRE